LPAVQTPDSQSVAKTQVAPSWQKGAQAGDVAQSTWTFVTGIVPIVPVAFMTVQCSVGPEGCVTTVTS
jgi:hypothetical protein